MWLGCARFKSRCTNISLGVNYTNKKIIYKFLKKKFKSRGSIEPPEHKVMSPMLEGQEEPRQPSS